MYILVFYLDVLCHLSHLTVDDGPEILRLANKQYCSSTGISSHCSTSVHHLIVDNDLIVNIERHDGRTEKKVNDDDDDRI